MAILNEKEKASGQNLGKDLTKLAAVGTISTEMR